MLRKQFFWAKKLFTKIIYPLVFALILMPITQTNVLADTATADNSSEQVSSSLKVDRLAGEDRYGTAVAISRAGWSSASAVILTSGNDANLVDALTSAPLAKAKGAPILFTGSDRLNPQTEAEIIRLGVTGVYVTSGPEVIPDSELSGLVSRGITIHRLGGNDRYETSLNIAREFLQTNPLTSIALTNAFSSADALSIAPIAAALGIPIILTAQDSVPPSVSGFLTSANPGRTFVIGETGVIAGSLEGALPNPTRLGGTDRYDTNRIVVEAFRSSVRADTIYVANGANAHLIDSLAGSSLAAAMGCQIILSEQNILPRATAEYINSTLAVNNVVLLGGQSVIDQAVTDAISPTPGAADSAKNGGAGAAGSSGGDAGGSDSPTLSAAKAIAGFTFAGLSPAITGSVTESAHTITAVVPTGTTVTALVPTITVSAAATVSPTSGAAQNFTSPVTYTVTAEDGTTQTYTVTVTVTVPPAPTISSFTPDGGSPYNAGTEVTITGTNLAATTGVKFGTLDAASFTIVSDTQLKAFIPVPAAGTVPVAITVTTPGGSVTSADTFTYDLTSFTAISTQTAETGKSFSFNLGNICGSNGVKLTSGTVNITVTSNNVLEGTAGLLFSGPKTVRPTGGLSSNISITLSQGGSQTLTVSIVGHSFSRQIAATVYNPPTVATVSPASGFYTGGTVVTLTGTHLTNVNNINMGGNYATITSQSDTSLVFTAPAKTGEIGATDITLYKRTGGPPLVLPGAFFYATYPAASIQAQVSLIGGANVPVTNVPVVFKAYDSLGAPLPYGGVYLTVWITDAFNGSYTVGSTTLSGAKKLFVADDQGQVTVTFTSGNRGVSDYGFHNIWAYPGTSDTGGVKSEYNYNNLPPAGITPASPTISGSGQAIFTVRTAGGALSRYNQVYARLVSSQSTGGKATWQNGLSRTTLENGGGFVPVITDNAGRIILDYVTGTNNTGATDTIQVALQADGSGAQTMTYTYPSI